MTSSELFYLRCQVERDAARRERECQAEAADKKAREEAARQEQILRPEFKRAELAAGYGVEEALPPALRLQIRHVVKLALEPPTVYVEWLRPKSRAADMLGDSGMALNSRPVIITPAICSQRDVATALHELGHHRSEYHEGQLQCEALAWWFAVRHALVWDRTCHKLLQHSLESYIRTAKRSGINILGLVECERVMSESTFVAHAKALSREQLDAFELELFHEKHGQRMCQWTYSCKQPARMLIDKWFICAQCAPHAHDSDVTRRARELRRHATLNRARAGLPGAAGIKEQRR